MNGEFFEEAARDSDCGLDIIDITVPDWKDSLLARLHPPLADTGRGPLDNILTLVRNELGGQCVVVEPYISTDWNSEYSAVYSRLFRPVPCQAQRLHFFANRLNYADIFDLPEHHRRSYLGYTVLRPLDAFRVGDTILASPWCVPLTCQDLVHCLEEFTVYLLGNRLTITGMPYLQQDRTVGACAQADLWMIARYYNAKREMGRLRPPEIHELATRSVMAPPQEGLTFLQMRNALNGFGFNPHLFGTVRDWKITRDFLYSCVESELPIIAGLNLPDDEGHVVVIIGHDYDPNVTSLSQSLSEAVSNFVIHDDASGPYKKAAVSCVSYKDKDVLTLDDHRVEWLIAPLPPRVHMGWDDVKFLRDFWLREATGYAAQVFGKAEATLWGDQDLSQIVSRIYLRRSSEFKQDLLRAKDHRDDKIIAKYKCMQMPKYVWVVELAKAPEVQNIPLHERRIRGEILIDSTAHRDVPVKALLAFHFNGTMFIPSMKPGEDVLLPTTGKPFSPLLRTAGA